MDLDGILNKKSAEWIMEQGERFYLSLGFPELPATFWEKSSLYPLPPDADYKKNNHASAWHMDLDKDVRSLMSVIPNTDWYETVHHELGHVYYYISYSQPQIPLLLRSGANRAFHEAIGSLMGLAAMQKPFLAHLDLLPDNQQTDDTQKLLKEALNYIIFIPWSAGVMTDFEYELYAAQLPENEYNKKWWELKRKYQGIIPPSERGEEYCDAASKTHISDDAAQYYDYALSYILLFQFHNHVSTKILKQNPHATNYYGRQDVGEFLKTVLGPGATQDWRKLLQETIGQEMSAAAMLTYFEPLMLYLKEKNKGRSHSLPETPQ
jgi:peptidyl-dipeptidase A